MRLVTCSSCGRPYERRVAYHGRCPTCEPHGRDQRSPTTRAQDAEYRAERARVLAPGPDGHPPSCVLRIRCDGAPATTVDHVVPVARGGRHAGNLVPACAACNASKQDSSAAANGSRAVPRPVASEPTALRLA